MPTFDDRADYEAALNRGHRNCSEGLCRACDQYLAWFETDGAELEELYEAMLDSLGLPDGALLDAS